MHHRCEPLETGMEPINWKPSCCEIAQQYQQSEQRLGLFTTHFWLLTFGPNVFFWWSENQNVFDTSTKTHLLTFQFFNFSTFGVHFPTISAGQTHSSSTVQDGVPNWGGHLVSESQLWISAQKKVVVENSSGAIHESQQGSMRDMVSWNTLETPWNTLKIGGNKKIDSSLHAIFLGLRLHGHFWRGAEAIRPWFSMAAIAALPHPVLHGLPVGGLAWR